MRRPTAVHAHGFLTINGQKMSKSRGTFITARRYLDLFEPEYLRYYFAAKLGPGIDDIDMNLDEFATRLNSDIVGKLVNIASRCAGFITKQRRRAGSADALPDPELYARVRGRRRVDRRRATKRATRRGAMRDIMALADRANQYIDSRKPWMLAKQPDKRRRGAERLHAGPESVSRADDLSAAGAARHGGAGAALLSGTGLDLGERRDAAARHAPSCRTSRSPRGSIRKPLRGWSSPTPPSRGRPRRGGAARARRHAAPRRRPPRRGAGRI